MEKLHRIARISLVVLLLASLPGCRRSDQGGKEGGRVVLENKGSDTLVNVAQAWAEAYSKVNPNVGIAVTGGGTGTGIAALINGTVDIANASRKITEEEQKMAENNGHTPVEFTVGYDALAIFVHKDNPLASITLEQLAEVYGDGGQITKWSDLGVEVPGCDSKEIILVSRQNNSGTYAYFGEAVLGTQRDFKLGTRDMHGSKDVVDLVAKTPCAVGYSGLAYETEEIRMVPVAFGETAPVTPSMTSAIDGSYPIARPLFMYSSNTPTGAVKEYLDWVLSDEGQCIIHDLGYAPVRQVACSGQTSH